MPNDYKRVFVESSNSSEIVQESYGFRSANSNNLNIALFVQLLQFLFRD